MDTYKYVILALEILGEYYEDQREYHLILERENEIEENFPKNSPSKHEQRRILEELAETPFLEKDEIGEGEKDERKERYRYGGGFSESLSGNYPDISDRKMYAAWAYQVLKSENGEFMKRREIDKKISKVVDITCSKRTKTRGIKEVIKNSKRVHKKCKNSRKYRWTLTPPEEEQSEKQFTKNLYDLGRKYNSCDYCSEKEEVFDGEKLAKEMHFIPEKEEKIFFLIKAPPRTEGAFHDENSPCSIREELFKLLHKFGFEIRNLDDFKDRGFYLSNVVKCPFKENRVKYEGLPCFEKYLKKEIALVSPNILLPMGNTATRAIQDIGKLKEKNIRECHGESDYSSELDLQLSYNYSPTAQVKDEVKREDLKAGLKRGGFL